MLPPQLRGQARRGPVHRLGSAGRSTAASAQQLAELAKRVGVGTAQQLEDDRLGGGDDGAGLAGLANPFLAYS